MLFSDHNITPKKTQAFRIKRSLQKPIGISDTRYPFYFPCFRIVKIPAPESYFREHSNLICCQTYGFFKSHIEMLGHPAHNDNCKYPQRNTKYSKPCPEFSLCDVLDDKVKH